MGLIQTCYTREDLEIIDKKAVECEELENQVLNEEGEIERDVQFEENVLSDNILDSPNHSSPNKNHIKHNNSLNVKVEGNKVVQRSSSMMSINNVSLIEHKTSGIIDFQTEGANPMDDSVIFFQKDLIQLGQEGNNIDGFKELADYSYIQIFVENLDVSYKLIDDFGSVFKPFIEVIVPENNPQRIQILSLDEEKLNNSNYDNSDLELSRVSFTGDTYSPIKTPHKSKNSLFIFNAGQDFVLKKNNIFGSIRFLVKNELQKNTMSLKDSLVVMGECYIPLNLIYSSEFKQDNCVEVNMVVKLRRINVIGNLRVLIAFSNKKFTGTSDALKLVKNKDVNIINMYDISMTNPKSEVFWDRDYLTHCEIPPHLLLAHFLNNDINKEYKNMLNEVTEITTFDGQSLFSNLKRSIEDNNLIVTYYLLINFIKAINSDKNSLNNLLMINNKPFNDNSTISVIEDYLRNLYHQAKNYQNAGIVDDDFNNVFKDCIYWALNIYAELTTQSTDRDIQINTDMKKVDFQNVFNNAIQILSMRNEILKLIELMIDDTQFISSALRLFRKTILILTNENAPKESTDISPKQFARELKKLLITQGEGIFIILMKIIISKYSHYSELHVNILIILGQLSNIPEKEMIIYLSKKLNLEAFKDCFDYYRGKLRLFGKVLHNLHLNVISNLSELVNYDIKEKEEEDTINIMKAILTDLRSCFKNTPNYRKRYEDFKARKLQEIEIHELVTRIGVNISNEPQLSYHLVDDTSLFSNDIISFLKSIVDAGNESKKNFIDELMKGKTRKKNDQQCGKILISIIENSLIIILNILASPPELALKFVNKLPSLQIEDGKALIDLINECKKLVKGTGVSVKKLEGDIEHLKKLFEV